MRVSIRALLALAVWAGVASAQAANNSCVDVEGSIYDYTLSDANGDDFSLDEYRGKVIVIFNSATYWGFTEQYVSWNAVKASINDSNFDLLAIPTNQFGLQEPGSNTEIPLTLKYVRPGNGYEPDFRLAGKTDCNGAREEDLFSFLKGACPGPQLVMGDTERYYFTPIKQHDITWNFEKFLINADGKPIRRYNPATSPYNVQPDIQELLDLIDNKEEEEKPVDVRKAKILQGMTNRMKKNKT